MYAIALEPPPYLSVENYLEEEAQGDVRHEYIGGLIFAMAGGTKNHDTICLNFASELRSALRGGSCRPWTSNMKLRIQMDDREIFYYPDLTVTCDPQNTEQDYNESPKVIVEVLSPSTENTDRREKFWNYIQIDSLEEYVLVAQDQTIVTIFRRANKWKPEQVTSIDGEVRLISLGISIRVRDLYEGALV